MNSLHHTHVMSGGQGIRTKMEGPGNVGPWARQKEVTCTKLEHEPLFALLR